MIRTFASSPCPSPHLRSLRQRSALHRRSCLRRCSPVRHKLRAGIIFLRADTHNLLPLARRRVSALLGIVRFAERGKVCVAANAHLAQLFFCPFIHRDGADEADGARYQLRVSATQGSEYRTRCVPRSLMSGISTPLLAYLGSQKTHFDGFPNTRDKSTSHATTHQHSFFSPVARPHLNTRPLRGRRATVDAFCARDEPRSLTVGNARAHSCSRAGP